MRYPFQPELLDALPEELCGLFRSLELKLLEEICSRLKISGQLNEVTVQDIRALRSHGLDLEDIKRAVAKAAGTGMDQLNALLDNVVQRNQAYYTSMIGLAQVTAPERLIDQKDIYAICEQTRGEYRNITRSMGFLVRQGRRRIMLPPGRAYQWALDSALLQVQSGAVSYSQAIAEQVKQLAESGLKTVSYDSGHVDSVDVAVRRALMTGVNQLNAKYREQSSDYLETDLVEVTAHTGARDTGTGPANHKSWQGKGYRRSQKPRASRGSYPDLVKKTGYGTGEGLCGWNCRHSFYPFLEGVSERAYTDGELENIDPPPVTFEGRSYTAYEATQMQRRIERTVRRQKRLKTAYQAAGLTVEAQAASIRLRRLNETYRAFSKAAGLPEQRERMKSAYVDDASTRKAAELLEKQTRSGILSDRESAAITRYISSDSYRLNFALRGGQPLNAELSAFRDDLDLALKKLPAYKGITYRSVSDFGIPDIAEFLRAYTPGETKEFPAYLSTGTKVYDPDLPIQYVIQSQTGRDLQEYNPTEFEILFQRGKKFLIQKVDGNTIFMEEIDDG